MAISIGDAILKMGIDKADFDNSMKSMDAHIQTSMQKLQSGLRIGGAAFTAFGAAGLKMVSSARELNATLGQTALTTGTTTKEMRDMALSLTNVTFPLNEVVSTMDLLARAGIRDEESIKATATAFDTLGDAIGSTASKVTDQMIMAMKTYQLNAEQIAAETDKVTYLVRNTALSMDDFASVIGYITPELVDMGLTMDDTIALLGIMESKGVSGAVATRAFRSAITQATNEGISLAEALGVTTEEMDDYKEKLDDSTGLTQEFADEANKQYGIMDKVKQKFDEISLAAGSFLTPLEPILGAMTALGPVMLFFSTGMGTAAVKTVAHTAALIAHNVALVASKVAIAAATAAQWLWNAAMSANPIGLIILGIAALVAAIVLLVKNWDAVKEKTIEVWNTVVNFLKGVWDNIVGFFKENWDKILAILFPAVGIPILIARQWESVKDAILGPVRAAADGIEDAISWIIRSLNKLSFDIPDWIPGIGGKSFGLNIPEINLPKFGSGGLITEPTLLYGLRSMKPYAIAGEQGNEVVSPTGAGITNNFNISQLVVRKESDVQLVARELLRMQQQRGYAGG
jgi:uncharacterized protein YukE